MGRRRKIKKIGVSDDIFTLMFRFVSPLQRPYRRRRHHGRKHHHSVKLTHSRYRELDHNNGLFLNRDHGAYQIRPFTVLGTERFFQNYKVSKVNRVTNGGSFLDPTVHVTRTWDRVNPGPPFKVGGPFRLIEYNLPSSGLTGAGSYNNRAKPGLTPGTWLEYNGSFADDGFWLGGSYSSLKNTSPPSLSSLSSYYARAWDQTKPSIPKAGVAQFVYELRDLPGSIETSANAFHGQWKVLGGADPFNPLAKTVLEKGQFGGRKSFRQIAIPYMHPKEVADHFLNHSFGWVPFLSDISKIIDTFNRTADHISRLVRDNGSDVRRMRVLEESDEMSLLGGNDISATLPSANMIGGTGTNSSAYCLSFNHPWGTSRGYCQFEQRLQRRVWAVGSFRYYRPEFDPKLFDGNSFSEFYRVQQLFTLYGARINPTLIYKLTPWTWLADWFTNFGSHLQRLDDFVTDGITAKYLYVMQQEIKSITKTCVLNFYSGPVSVNFQRMLTTKRREAADGPYGFNTPWNSLSPRQWAILAAIGVSRSNNGYISRGA